MARPTRNDHDLDLANASIFGARVVRAGSAATAAWSVFGNARSLRTSNSTATIWAGPLGASSSIDVGTTFVPASPCHDMHVRRKGMGALGRRYPAR